MMAAHTTDTTVLVGVRTLEGTDTATLSSEEMARAARIRSTDDRRRWIAGRTWLRTALGSRLGVEPASIRFEYGPRGKPQLAWPASPLSFSLSHSGATGMLAIGQVAQLGIDCEIDRIGVYDRAAAVIVLTSDEIAWIERGTNRDHRFLRCWVRKEAYAKALGTGLEPELRDVRLTPRASSALGLELLDHEEPGLFAAIAVPSGCNPSIEELPT